MDKQKIIDEVLYALRIGADPVGALLRELGILPFTGRTISYLNEDGEPLDRIDDDDIIYERQLAWLERKDKAGVLEVAGGFIIPFGWDDVLIEYLKSAPRQGVGGMIRVTTIDPPEKWERYKIVPNKGYPGNAFEYVVFSYGGTYVNKLISMEEK